MNLARQDQEVLQDLQVLKDCQGTQVNLVRKVHLAYQERLAKLGLRVKLVKKGRQGLLAPRESPDLLVLQALLVCEETLGYQDQL